MASLQDQLLKAGMIDEKKAKKIKKEQRKKAKQIPKGQSQVDETKEQAKKTLAEKSERDRESNRQREKAATQKAIAAQIKQLIDVNRIDRQGSDVKFQFTDGTKIKTLYVTSLLQNQLSSGLIAITSLNQQYELVPAAVAEKIKQRDENIVVLQNVPGGEEIDADDPYADYKIPDDLMW